MAWHENAERIGTNGLADPVRQPRIAKSLGNRTIGGRRTEKDLGDDAPHRILKGVARGVERQIETLPHPRQVLEQLLHCGEQ